MKEVWKETFAINTSMYLQHIEPEEVMGVIGRMLAAGNKKWRKSGTKPLKGRDIDEFFSRRWLTRLPTGYRQERLGEHETYGHSVYAWNRKTTLLKAGDWIEFLVYDPERIAAATHAKPKAATELVIRYLDIGFFGTVISELVRLDSRKAYQPNSL